MPPPLVVVIDSASCSEWQFAQHHEGRSDRVVWQLFREEATKCSDSRTKLSLRNNISKTVTVPYFTYFVFILHIYGRLLFYLFHILFLSGAVGIEPPALVLNWTPLVQLMSLLAFESAMP